MDNKKGMSANIFVGGIIAVAVIVLFLLVAVLLSSKFSEESWESTTITINETLTAVLNSTYNDIADVDDYRHCALTLTAVHNTTEGGAEIEDTQYTISDCGVKALAGSIFQNRDWHIYGTAVYDKNTDATDIIEETQSALGDFSDYIPLLILLLVVVGIMVLVGMMILAIRNTGMIGGGGAV